MPPTERWTVPESVPYLAAMGEAMGQAPVDFVGRCNSARRPGLQAVVERVLKAVGYSALVDGGAVSLAGNGNLDNGSMVSPEQCLLDLDLTEGLTALWTAPVVPAPGDTVARLRDAVLSDAGSFLMAEHTLTHYRDGLWDTQYFPTLVETHSERDILDHCHADHRRLLASYTPASYPADVLRELERILQRARAALV